MKGFEIKVDQVAAVVGALVADELSWRFRRHLDYLTMASLSPTTELGIGGLRLDGAERTACARRAASFFGQPPESLREADAETLADWAGAVHAAARARLVAFSFTPAGRDSEKESVRHAADVVYADAAQASKLLYGRRRLISLVAPHSFMGFVLTILAPNVQQIPMVDARGVPPDALNEMLTFGDAVVATPSLWRFLLREKVKASDNAMELYFGEAMEPAQAIDLRKAGFAAQREIYGSTETGLIGWRDSPGAPFMLFDRLTREDEELGRRAPNGETARVTPMDVLEWQNERTFRLGARRDGAVQVGAVNVFPERIAATICEHSEVAECRVDVARHEGGYNRLVARIALKAGRAPTERTARSIDQWCRAQLRPQERPRIYHFEASPSGA